MSRARRLVRWGIYGLILPLGGVFTLGNIALNSKWSKQAAAHQLELRTGEKWSIKTMTFSLRGRLYLYGVTSDFGHGGVSIEEIALTPNYALMLEKRWRFSELHIVRPVVVLRDAWILKKLEGEKAAEAQSPLLASVESAASEAAGGATASEPNNAQPSGEASTPGEELTPAAVAKKIAVTSQADLGAVGNNDPSDFYEAWVKVSDARFAVATAGGELVSLDGISADIPVGGKDLTGQISWRALSSLGRELVDEGSIQLEKLGPGMRMKEAEVDFFGIRVLPSVQFVRTQQGPVFFIDLQIPEQKVVELLSHLDLTVSISAEHAAGRMQLLGIATHPLSWIGSADVRALELRATESHRGTTAAFDSFILQAALSRGVLQSPRIQLRGEEVSVMSNGVMAMNGYGYGVLRIVTSPQMRDWVQKLVDGSVFFDGLHGPAMRPMETADLYYMDVRFDGNVLAPMMQIDQKTDWQPLWPAVQRMQKFIKDERAEEHVGN